MNEKIYRDMMADLEGVVRPGVKKALRVLIKERRDKDQQQTVIDDLEELKSLYVSSCALLFEQIKKGAMIDALIRYSGYQEPKEDE